MTSEHNQQLADVLGAQFGEGITAIHESYGILTIDVARESLIALMQFLKTDERFGFHFLTDLCGIHLADVQPELLGTVYHLHNWHRSERIRVRCTFLKSDPHVPTLTTLWGAANWQERETYDFYGILFDGHPDLRRILNIDDMDFFPLRKEYPLEEQTRNDKPDYMFGR